MLTNDFEISKGLYLSTYVKEHHMFNKLWSLISSEYSSLETMSFTLLGIDDILKHLADHYSKDGDAYDAAIDTICQILQEHKNKKTPPQTNDTH